MAKIGFIGLGSMGLPMAKKLIKEGHEVKGFDSSKKALVEARKIGMEIAPNIAEAVKGVEVVISMVPDGKQSKAVYLNADGVLKNAEPGTLLIDCSNVYTATSHDIHRAAEKAGFEILDAPVAGGPEGAKKGTLSFMVRGEEKAFLEGEPILESMAGLVIHYGPVGKHFNKQKGEDKPKVIYKQKGKWKGAAVIVMLLFLGGNAVFYALIEDSIRIVDGRLTVSLDLGPTEQKIFCRGSELIGLDIEGC